MDIIDYPNYTIDRDGIVKNKTTGKILQPVNDKDGYKMIGLSNNGFRKCLKIHRLLGLHYIPNPENKPHIDHIDRNKLNNDLSNLRWATYSENSINRTHSNEDYCIEFSNKNINRPYVVRIKRNFIRYYIGSYATIEEARVARDSALTLR